MPVRDHARAAQLNSPPPPDAPTATFHVTAGANAPAPVNTIARTHRSAASAARHYHLSIGRTSHCAFGTIHRQRRNAVVVALDQMFGHVIPLGVSGT
jgi:hypothetical protein